MNSDLVTAIRGLIAEATMRSPDEIEPDQPLLSSGLIDSRDFLYVIQSVEERFNIHIGPEDLRLENWDQIRGIENLIRRLKS